ncbi:MAG TPA: PD-(D/E)XK nuclease family protein, partial [Candidatus Polarisedimenticolia bacterium]|nr:PD-(D/E)XK nuclease family protein [Candidatus Polarisedimenticolia bacterium]
VPPVRSPSALGGAEETAAATPDPRPAARTAREVARLAGSAVHAALQRWDFRDAPRLRDLGRQTAARVLEEDAAQATPERRRRVVGETAEIIEEFLRSPLPARLASLPLLGREVPVLFRDETGATWSGACDLVYRDERGRLVIADYKTERLDGPPAVAAERHRPQMEIYREAFRRALGETTVVGEILFVRAGVSVAL